MIKKILYYEDIEDVTFSEVQKTIEWYEALEKKESLFFLENRDTIEMRYPKEGSVGPVLYVHKLVFWADNMKEFENSLLTHGYEFKHKKTGDRTEQLQAKLLQSPDMNNEGKYYTLIDMGYMIVNKTRDVEN